MTRRMSCSMTVDAVCNRTKTVTRRHADTWATLKPGDGLTLVEGMGLAKGEKQVILAEVEIIDVRVEQLGLLYQWDTGLGWHVGTDYGYAEMAAEGLPDMEPYTFARWWALGHGHRDAWEAGCDRTIECRRIEWRYLDRSHVCPNCGCSFSLPLGRTCDDHGPVEVWR